MLDNFEYVLIVDRLVDLAAAATVESRHNHPSEVFRHNHGTKIWSGAIYIMKGLALHDVCLIDYFDTVRMFTLL